MTHATWPVVDFGCAEFSFFTYLKHFPGVEEVLEVDIDKDLLMCMKCRTAPLNCDYLNTRTEPLTVYILEGNIARTDSHLLGTDAVICIEIIEHLYPDTLEDVPYTVFGFVRPLVAIFTTPNIEFNALFPNPDGFRHHDHKFEWTRSQATNIVGRYPDYTVEFVGIGPPPEGFSSLGCCSQMAVFVKQTPHKAECHSISADSRTEPESSGKVSQDEDSYNLLETYTYPFHVDTRTDREKICDEAQYYISMWSRESVFDTGDHIEIPLRVLLPMVQKWCHSPQLLRSTLEGGGWKVAESVSGELCVIERYPYEHSSSSSSVGELDDRVAAPYVEDESLLPLTQTNLEIDDWWDDDPNPNCSTCDWKVTDMLPGLPRDSATRCSTLSSVDHISENYKPSGPEVGTEKPFENTATFKDTEYVPDSFVPDKALEHVHQTRNAELKPDILGSFYSKPLVAIESEQISSIENSPQSISNTSINKNVVKSASVHLNSSIISNVSINASSFILPTSITSTSDIDSFTDSDHSQNLSFLNLKSDLSLSNNHPITSDVKCSSALRHNQDCFEESLKVTENKEHILSADKNVCFSLETVENAEFQLKPLRPSRCDVGCSSTESEVKNGCIQPTKSVKTINKCLNDVIEPLGTNIIDSEGIDSYHLLSGNLQPVSHINVPKEITSELNIDLANSKPNEMVSGPMFNAQTFKTDSDHTCINSIQVSAVKMRPTTANRDAMTDQSMSLNLELESSRIPNVFAPNKRMTRSLEVTMIDRLDDSSIVDSFSLEEQNSKAVDSGYPNSSSVQDMDLDRTPEQFDEIFTEDVLLTGNSIFDEHNSDYDDSLSNASDVSDHLDNEGQLYRPMAPVPNGLLREVLDEGVENGDVANNNRDEEGNNAAALIPEDIMGPALEFDLIPLWVEDVDNENNIANNVALPENADPFPPWLLNLVALANFGAGALHNQGIPGEGDAPNPAHLLFDEDDNASLVSDDSALELGDLEEVFSEEEIELLEELEALEVQVSDEVIVLGDVGGSGEPHSIV
uniref:Small RNA 2'-O-methyltransferase n=1 Tax=Timema cristinae TaxID=61476 RepID=A0A7R9H117_TIMCR|nr:unnamed protein product [Timema cristinae]